MDLYDDEEQEMGIFLTIDLSATGSLSVLFVFFETLSVKALRDGLAE